MKRASISHESRFTAEHQPPGHERHVTEFRLVVTVEGPIVDGIVIPFETIGAAVANLHRVIVAVPPVEAMPASSSVEQIAVWIWEQLARRWRSR